MSELLPILIAYSVIVTIYAAFLTNAFYGLVLRIRCGLVGIWEDEKWQRAPYSSRANSILIKHEQP